MHRRALALTAAALAVLSTACLGNDAASNDRTPDSATTEESDRDITVPAHDSEGPAVSGPATDDPGPGASPDDAASPDDTGSEDAAGSITVTGVDYAFEGLPAELAAGTSITFTNASDVEAHELVLVRLPDDETRPVEELLEDFEPTTEPALVSVAAPGEDGQVFVGDGVVTEPGRYIAVCFLPVGGDPEEILSGDGPPQSDAPPHAVEGMVAEVVVT